MKKRPTPLIPPAKALTGKDGMLKHDMQGKRINMCARTVIIGNPDLEISQIGVPEAVCVELSMPERVYALNREELARCVRIGKGKLGGASEVITLKKETLLLGTFDEKGRDAIARNLRDGFIVKRHLRDGDPIMMNRQPTLHRGSMMTHSVKVTKSKCFELSAGATGPYNADFDGDEMNAVSMQTLEARAECVAHASLRLSIVSSAGKGLIIAFVQDAQLGLFSLSRRSQMFDRAEACNLLMATRAVGAGASAAPRGRERAGLPPAAVFFRRGGAEGSRGGAGRGAWEGRWSGKQLVSQLIPTDVSMTKWTDKRGKAERERLRDKTVARDAEDALWGAVKEAEAAGDEDAARRAKDAWAKSVMDASVAECPAMSAGEAYCEVRDGEVLCGNLNKDVMGKAAGTVTHRVAFYTGQSAAADFISRCNFIACEHVFAMDGPSIGLDDFIVPTPVHKSAVREMDAVKLRARRALAKVEPLVDKLSDVGREAVEGKVLELLSTGSQVASGIIMEHLHSLGEKDMNGLWFTVKSGAKGSTTNLTHLLGGGLGQQFIMGKRLRIHADSRRALPCARRGLLSVEAQGFVTTSFMDGIPPEQMIAHVAAAREDQVEVAKSVPLTGYMFQRTVTANADVYAAGDGSVRATGGRLLQAAYGEDGCDPKRLVLQTIQALSAHSPEAVAEEVSMPDAVRDLFREVWLMRARRTHRSLANVEANESAMLPFHAADVARREAFRGWKIQAGLAQREQKFDAGQDDWAIQRLRRARVRWEEKERERRRERERERERGVGPEEEEEGEDCDQGGKCDGSNTFWALWEVLAERFPPALAQNVLLAACEKFSCLCNMSSGWKMPRTTTSQMDGATPLERACAVAIDMCERARVAGGDAVGIIAAGDAGEGATQNALSSFHHAGQVNMGLLTGVARENELLCGTKLKSNGKSSLQTPTMRIPLITPSPPPAEDGGASSSSHVKGKKQNKKKKKKKGEASAIEQFTDSLHRVPLRDVLAEDGVWLDPAVSGEAVAAGEVPVCAIEEDEKTVWAHHLCRGFERDLDTDPDGRRLSPFIVRFLVSRRAAAEKGASLEKLVSGVQAACRTWKRPSATAAQLAPGALASLAPERKVTIVASSPQSDAWVIRVRCWSPTGSPQDPVLTRACAEALHVHLLNSAGVQRRTRFISRVCVTPGFVRVLDEERCKVERRPVWCAHTRGSSLSKVAGMWFADWPRTYTNDIQQIQDTLGIFAARRALEREFMQVFSGKGHFDERHVQVFASRMCHSGRVDSVDRFGLNRDPTSRSWTVRASFEDTVPVIFEAANSCGVATDQDMCSSVMVGSRLKMGTGQVHLLREESDGKPGAPPVTEAQRAMHDLTWNVMWDPAKGRRGMPDWLRLELSEIEEEEERMAGGGGGEGGGGGGGSAERRDPFTGEGRFGATGQWAASGPVPSARHPRAPAPALPGKRVVGARAIAEVGELLATSGGLVEPARL